MNNQVKLIDADKTLEWFIQHLDHFHVERFQEAINRGILAPDTPPVPTIKPGDKMIHSDLGEVRIMDTPTVKVLKDKEEYEVFLDDLEVVE
jgi:hypothetical protein